MGTIPEKLDYLLGTKNEIKKSIQNKGIVVTDEDKFRDYATKINSITVSKTQEKTINITSNGTTTVTPDSGKTGLSKVTITTSVNTVKNQNKSATVTANGSATYKPDSHYTGLGQVTITTNVARDAVQYGPGGTVTRIFEGNAATAQLTKSGRFTIPANKNCVVIIVGVTAGGQSFSCKVNNTAQTAQLVSSQSGKAFGNNVSLQVMRYYISRSSSARTCVAGYESGAGVICSALYII